MFNKTVGFVNAFPAVPKARKSGKTAWIPFTLLKPPFRWHYPGTLFGKILKVMRFPLLGWPIAPRKAVFYQNDGFRGCVRDGKKERLTETTVENEKSGKPPKAPSMGSLKRLAAFLII